MIEPSASMAVTSSPAADVASSARQPALLLLADGLLLRGEAFGARGTVLGEVVFNTGMTGYQEVLTDPSYAGQLVTIYDPTTKAPFPGNIIPSSRFDTTSKKLLQFYPVANLPGLSSNFQRVGSAPINKATLPPNCSVIPMAIGAVTDLAAMEASTSGLAPSSQAIPRE